MKEDAITVSGIDPRLTSIPQSGTATQAAIVRESAIKRVRSKMWLAQKLMMKRLARLRIANIEQFYSIPKIEALTPEGDYAQYLRELLEAKARKTLIFKEGVPFIERYRRVRLKDKQIVPTGNKLVEKRTQGYTFFEATPEYLKPHQELDIVIQAGSSVPISKPLLQMRTETLFQHPVIVGAIATGAYDPVKIADKLMRVHDENPEEFRADVDQGKGKVGPELALNENQMIVSGFEVPATPFADQDHTAQHIEFAKSEQFKAIPIEDQRMRVFIEHVMGEIEAQKRRGIPAQQVAPELGLPPELVAAGGLPQQGEPANNPLAGAMPGMVQGGAQVPPVAGLSPGGPDMMGLSAGRGITQ